MPGRHVVNEAKRGLRAQVRAARRALDPGQRAAESAAAAACCERLLAGAVPASYVALPDELDLGALHGRCWAAGRPVHLPRVAGPGRLTWHAVTAAGQLVPGAYGIREPDPASLPVVELPAGAIVLVPGVAFTRDGRRLGQGGGFYDRLLEARPDLRPVGVGFACQLMPDLPSEVHDRPLCGLVIAGEVVLAPSPT